jgi:hypothetical protein
MVLLPSADGKPAAPILLVTPRKGPKNNQYNACDRVGFQEKYWNSNPTRRRVGFHSPSLNPNPTHLSPR